MINGFLINHFLSPQGAYMRNDVFEDTAVLCQRVNKQVGEVFSSPETVMAKLIQNIFENKLQVFLPMPVFTECHLTVPHLSYI